MADDATPILPDQAVLNERAKRAGIDLEALPDIARIRRLRELRTDAEKKALAERQHVEIEEDARRYNAYVDRYGIWNAKIRGW